MFILSYTNDDEGGTLDSYEIKYYFLFHAKHAFAFNNVMLKK